MYGQDRSNPNSNKAVQPLRDYTLKEWWWHGAMNDKPDKNAVFHLPAGGKADLEIADNKAFTSMGAHGMFPNPRKAPVPWYVWVTLICSTGHLFQSNCSLEGPTPRMAGVTCTLSIARM